MARPVPPKDLDAVGKKAWTSLCDDLLAVGKLDNTDRKTIELFARTFSLYERTRKQLDKEDLTAVTENGRAFINPLANLQHNTSIQLLKILRECGITPGTRKSTPQEVGDWGDVLGGI